MTATIQDIRSDALISLMRRPLLSGPVPARLALEMERDGLVECSASKYQRKTRDELDCRITARGRRSLPKVVLGATRQFGTECAECGGCGEHLHYSYEWAECVACDGTGELADLY